MIGDHFYHGHHVGGPARRGWSLARWAVVTGLALSMLPFLSILGGALWGGSPVGARTLARLVTP